MAIPRIIGLSGKIGSGKTTVTNLLLERFPEYKRIAFGDILKSEASVMHNFPLDWAYSEEGKAEVVQMILMKEEKPLSWLQRLKKFATCEVKHEYELKLKEKMTVREVLQWHGTEFRRKQNPNYWVGQMEKFIKGQPWVMIDDVRFPNEAEMVLKLGGILIRIDPHNKWKPGKYANHVSETSLDNYTKFDLTVQQIFDNPSYAVDCVSSYIQNLN